jgi:lipopolysaccharide transport system ATP-binding protein
VTKRYLATLYATNQDISGVAGSVEETQAEVKQLVDKAEYRDMRAALINNSNLRNDIEIFQFKPDQTAFGTGNAKITGVQLLGKDGLPLSWVVGGEDVSLLIRCFAFKIIRSPIVGFQFKDRLGQVVFSDNTYLSYQHAPLVVGAGTELLAQFDFRLPILPSGDYSVSPAVAEGTQDEHVQHHWLHDGMMLRVHATSVCFGLIGVPMKKICLESK